MGLYLDPVADTFEDAVNSRIYIDKSMLIGFTNEKIKTEQRFICVSRPRRFGKSMTANMLSAYYGRFADSRRLFEGLKISGDESFEKHFNKYDVIYLTMTDFISNSESVEEMLERIDKCLTYELEKAYPNADIYPDSTLAMKLGYYYLHTRIRFVFIIDEWDCVLRNSKFNNSDHIKYLDFLRCILKDKPYTALAYMTGILPIKKYGEHSALNMFQEYSMTYQEKLAEFTGFTRQETDELCEKFDMSKEEMREWYDGYNAAGTEIYNPQSVVSAVIGRKFGTYWTRTETYNALKPYIQMDFYGLHDKVIQLMAGERLVINPEKFQNDMKSLNSADDVFALLVHLGYLTYDENTNEVRIPNKEVKFEYLNSMEDGGWENVIKLISRSDDLLNAVLSMDEEKTAALMEQAHQDNTSILKYNDENSLSCVVALAFFAANSDYVLHRELAGGKGFADMVFIPRNINKRPALIVELKKGDTAENALKQIKEKNYTDGVKGQAKEALLIGLSYSENKRHECKIEKVIL